MKLDNIIIALNLQSLVVTLPSSGFVMNTTLRKNWLFLFILQQTKQKPSSEIKQLINLHETFRESVNIPS